LPLWLHEVISREGCCGKCNESDKKSKVANELAFGGGTGSTRSVCKLKYCKYIHQWARHGQDNGLKSLIRLRCAKVHLFSPGGPPTFSRLLLLPTRLFIILSTSCFATLIASSFGSGLSIFLCHSPVIFYFNSSRSPDLAGQPFGDCRGCRALALLHSSIPKRVCRSRDVQDLVDLFELLFTVSLLLLA
jgi:hypothetical protein